MNHCKTKGKILILLSVLAVLLVSLGLQGCPGSSDDDDDSITIFPAGADPPMAGFNANPTWGQASLPVQFTDESDPGNARITGYYWSFGDGSTASEQHPLHVYQQTGTYTVMLLLESTAGRSIRIHFGQVRVSPNDVVAWNNVALKALAANNFMPPQSGRALAILHTAMYDAVNAVEGTHEVYYADVAAPAGACAETAAAYAAHRVLTQLLPAQTADFDAQLAQSLSYTPGGDCEAGGEILGREVADLILAWRSADGSAPMMGPPYLGGTDPGEWRPTPPSYSPGMFVMWRMVTPFALTSPDQFRPGPPPALDSELYAEDFNEVKEIGAKVSPSRTMDQSMMANFWVGMPGTIMETGRMNLVVQQAAEQHQLGLADSARLFALVNIAMADAAIAGIDCKYYHSAWRPVTAIWEAAGDGNPDTDADPAWEPYIVTPSHPEYISTHMTLTTAAAEVLESFFGDDDADLILPSFMDPNVTRGYNGYRAVAEEAGLSRLYGGIHFRFSYDEGAELGEEIGEYVFENFMRPL